MRIVLCRTHSNKLGLKKLLQGRFYDKSIKKQPSQVFWVKIVLCIHLVQWKKSAVSYLCCGHTNKGCYAIFESNLIRPNDDGNHWPQSNYIDGYSCRWIEVIGLCNMKTIACKFANFFEKTIMEAFPSFALGWLHMCLDSFTRREWKETLYTWSDSIIMRNFGKKCNTEFGCLISSELKVESLNMVSDFLFTKIETAWTAYSLKSMGQWKPINKAICPW
jgi:hypothetical protein